MKLGLVTGAAVEEPTNASINTCCLFSFESLEGAVMPGGGEGVFDAIAGAIGSACLAGVAGEGALALAAAVAAAAFSFSALTFSLSIRSFSSLAFCSKSSFSSLAFCSKRSFSAFSAWAF
jgi:hypothetical protein